MSGLLYWMNPGLLCSLYPGLVVRMGWVEVKPFIFVLAGGRGKKVRSLHNSGPAPLDGAQLCYTSLRNCCHWGRRRCKYFIEACVPLHHLHELSYPERGGGPLIPFSWSVDSHLYNSNLWCMFLLPWSNLGGGRRQSKVLPVMVVQAGGELDHYFSHSFVQF